MSSLVGLAHLREAKKCYVFTGSMREVQRQYFGYTLTQERFWGFSPRRGESCTNDGGVGPQSYIFFSILGA